MLIYNCIKLFGVEFLKSWLVMQNLKKADCHEFILKLLVRLFSMAYRSELGREKCGGFYSVNIDCL